MAVLCGALALSGLNILAAQETYTLADLEKRAVERSYSVAAMVERQASFENKLAANRALALPEISTFYRYYQQGVDLDENLSSSHILSLRLSQDLVELIKVRRSKSREIRSEIEVARSQIESRRAKSLFDFRMQYLDVVEGERRSRSYQALVEKYEELLVIHKARYQHNEALLTAVLAAEAELLNYTGLLNYVETRIQKQKAFITASLALEPRQVVWEQRAEDLPDLVESYVLEAALHENADLQLHAARAEIEHWRANTARYNDIKLMPFVGLRVRGDSFSELGTGPEFGLRFSMPLAYFSARNRKIDQHKANERYWQLESEQKTLDVELNLSALFDRYRLTQAQIKHSEKMLQLHAEKLRIERSKSGKKLSESRTDPAILLAIEIAKLKVELTVQQKLNERTRIYYEILYRAGLSRTDGLQDGGGYSSQSTDGNTQALWVWRAAGILDSPRARQRLLDTCHTQGVNRLFLSLNKRLLRSFSQDTTLHSFVADLQTAGVRVAALMGDPHWVHESNRQALLQNIKQFITDNFALPESSRLDAIHLDIEPQTLDEWPTSRVDLLDELATTITAVKATIEASGHKLALEVDLPLFFDKVDAGSFIKIIRAADMITLMAYQRTAAGSIMKAVEDEIRCLAQQQTPFLIGLNIKDFERPDDLDATKTKIRRQLDSNPWFGGFAIHDYHHLLEKQNES